MLDQAYLKNKSKDDQKTIELLEDISRDLMNYDLEFRIQELESKFSVDMSETTFNELKELKKAEISIKPTKLVMDFYIIDII